MRFAATLWINKGSTDQISRQVLVGEEDLNQPSTEARVVGSDNWGLNIREIFVSAAKGARYAAAILTQRLGRYFS